jgi:IS5 family transposase
VYKRPDAQAGVNWHVAMKPGHRQLLDKGKPLDALIDQVERIKAGIRAKVEHPFRVIERGCQNFRVQGGVEIQTDGRINRSA